MRVMMGLFFAMYFFTVAMLVPSAFHAPGVSQSKTSFRL